jgi:hypothetical protein
MNNKEQLLLSLCYLLQEEVDALRSVLSEWDENKQHFVQWIRAENLRRVTEDLEHKK